MIKLLKPLLWLCILLLSGCTFYESISTAPAKNIKYFIVQKSQHSAYKPVLSSTKEENKQTHTTDIEEKENEAISFKKYLSFSKNIGALFYTQKVEYFFQYTQIDFCFFKTFSYYLSFKSLYLLFEVMRI